MGAVLDDILPAGAEEGGGADFPVDEVGLVDETEDLLTGADSAVQSPVGATAPMGTAVIPSAVQIAVAPVDPKTNIFGILMFLPMLALILAAVVLTAAIQNVVPSLMEPLVITEIAGVSLIWIVVSGLAALLLLILAVAALTGGGGTKTKKAKKPKKAKPAKKKHK